MRQAGQAAGGFELRGRSRGSRRAEQGRQRRDSQSARAARRKLARGFRSSTASSEGCIHLFKASSRFRTALAIIVQAASSAAGTDGIAFRFADRHQLVGLVRAANRSGTANPSERRLHRGCARAR